MQNSSAKLDKPIGFKAFKFLSMVGASSAISVPIEALSTILLAKFLAPNIFGVLLAGEAFVSMFSFFYAMGFQNSILKQASEKKDFNQGLSSALGNALLIRTLIIVPLALLITALAFGLNSDPLMVKTILAYTIITSLKSYMTLFGIVRKALNQYALISGINVFNKVFKLALIIGVFTLLDNAGLEMLLLAFVLNAVIKFIVAFVTTIRICKPQIDKEQVKPMLKDCMLYGFFNYFDNVQSSIDKLMINYIIGPSAVAFYSIPSKLNKLIKIVPTSFRQVFLPQIHQKSADQAETFKLLKKLLIALALVGLPISLGIYFGAEPLLGLFFDEVYEPAIKLAPLFAFISVIWFLDTIPKMLLAAQGDHKGRNWIQVTSISINVLLNIIFIPKFGIVGAIWATIIANSIRFILLLCRYIMKFMLKAAA